MSKVLHPSSIEHAVFEDDNSAYYPTACCEIFHIKKAIHIANALQFLFSMLTLFVYISLDAHGFIQATWLFRPIVFCSVFISVCGSLFALIGGVWRKTIFIHCQIAVLFFLISLSDTCAICFVFTMAIGKRTELTAKMPTFLVSTEKFNDILGPFWIYLLAMVLHMVAAFLMCLKGVNKRYLEYLDDREKFMRKHNEQADTNINLHDSPATERF